LWAKNRKWILRGDFLGGEKLVFGLAVIKGDDPKTHKPERF
jgi:hypothetical protein